MAPYELRNRAPHQEQNSPHSLKEKLSEATQATVDSAAKSLTVLWDHLPAWQRDNAYIIRGYRPESGSYWRSFCSLSYLHNESVNIYSHLIGAVLFAAVALAAAVRGLHVLSALWTSISSEASQVTVEAADVYVFACFFAGAVACLGMSATYHTICNHSPPVARWGNQLDYLGIVALIWGSFIPSIYYGFACDPQLVWTYWIMISTMATACAIITAKSTFRTPAWRPFRAFMFVALGLSAVFPVVHGLVRYGPARMRPLIALPWLVTQGALYITGATIYALRIPEKLAPARFDFFGSSHQIFHVLVLAAAIVHLIGLLRAHQYHHSLSRVILCEIVD